MGKGADQGHNQGEAFDATNNSFISKPSTCSPERSYNFCAGPAMIESDVMFSLAKQFCSWQGSGVSLIEMSQRDKGGPVQNMIWEAVENIRCNKVGQYIDGGFWSQRFATESAKYTKNMSRATSAYTCPDTGRLRYPDTEHWNVDESAAFLHVVSNETIQGLELGDLDVGNATLVADMTSTLLSRTRDPMIDDILITQRPVDVSKYGVIYASGGKNLGPAGVCVVIVREDLLDRSCDEVPSILSWKVMSDHNNLFNTQCMFAIWAMKAITDRLIDQGGLKVVAEKAYHRARAFYSVLDNSGGFYTNNVHPDFRSRTSIPFRIQGGNVPLENMFLKEADAAGLYQLAGHHSVGGLRVCLYNGIPDKALQALFNFMASFHDRYAPEV